MSDRATNLKMQLTPAHRISYDPWKANVCAERNAPRTLEKVDAYEKLQGLEALVWKNGKIQLLSQGSSKQL